MGMTVWAMLSSELGLVLLVVANFDESQKSELKTRTRAKLGLGMPKLEVNAPRREAHRSTNAYQECLPVLRHESLRLLSWSRPRKNVPHYVELMCVVLALANESLLMMF